MPASHTKESLVLDSLLLQDFVLAAVWIDRKGKIKERRGSATSLRLGADDPTMIVPLDMRPKNSGESAYVSRFADDDFLIVIFDESANFDALKQKIDAIISTRI